MEMDMKIKRGQILRRLRLSRQLTQNEAAENFGISQQTYQKYESGKTEAPYDLLCDFAVFYGVSTDYLLCLKPAPAPKDPFEVLGLKKSVDDDEFIRLYSTLPDFAKQIFVDTMAQLAQATTNNLKKQSGRATRSVESQQLSNQPIQQQPVQPPVIQSSPQRQIQQPPQQPVSTEPPPQSQIQIDPKNPWRFTARRTDGRYESRLATPEEIEKLRLMENDPEPDF